MAIRKQTAQGSVLRIDDSGIHKNIKIARDESAVKLGFSD